ncbi:hypothetical protein E4U12_001030, partial [Claviceps purpurea]
GAGSATSSGTSVIIHAALIFTLPAQFRLSSFVAPSAARILRMTAPAQDLVYADENADGSLSVSLCPTTIHLLSIA